MSTSSLLLRPVRCCDSKVPRGPVVVIVTPSGTARTPICLLLAREPTYSSIIYMLGCAHGLRPLTRARCAAGCSAAVRRSGVPAATGQGVGRGERLPCGALQGHRRRRLVRPPLPRRGGR